MVLGNIKCSPRLQRGVEVKRKIMNELLRWKCSKKERLPLLLYGARQVGKTFVMRDLGIEQFKNTIYVNFEIDERIRAYFDVDISPEYIIHVLEEYYHSRIIAEETLLIFDEIQMCERALTSLKYFAEIVPELHVIAAGSLLGVAINREKYSFPVGKVQMLTMYAMDFEEFLWAKGKELLALTIRTHFNTNVVLADAIHREAMAEYKEYLIVGGMPAVVMSYISPNASLKQNEIRQMILNSYIADMAKYTINSETVKIISAYESLPMQLAKDNKKFQYKLIKSGARASQYGDSIDWLIQAGVVYKCTKCEQGFMPPVAYQDLASFKLYYSDIGLLSIKTNMTLESLDRSESEHFRGIFTENYVACALKANGYELQYWESEGTAEVDFLIVKDSYVIPIECKASMHVKAKSLKIYLEKYKPEYCIRISSRNYGMIEGIKSVPLYAVFCI